jgi:hypothetical protein
MGEVINESPETRRVRAAFATRTLVSISAVSYTAFLVVLSCHPR